MKKIQNPYIHPKRQWNSIIGYSISRERTWQLYATISSILLVISLIGNIIQANKISVKPYLIAIDKIGTLYPIGIPHNIEFDQHVVEQQLLTYIIALRSFSIDSTVNEKNIDIVNSMTASRSLNKAINLMQLKNHPTNNISIKPIAIIPIAHSNTYQVDWVEKVNNQDSYWEANLTIEIKKYAEYDEEQITNNPLGIIIVELNITPKISGT